VEAVRRRVDVVPRPEYGTVTLLAAAGDPPLRDPALPAEPLSRPTLAPGGGGVRELRVGDLVGRRRELRTVLGVLRGTPPARDTFGDVAGVALTGVGGIGKTAVAGRVLARLRTEGWLVATHIGRWNPPGLVAAVADAAADIAELAQLVAVLRAPQVEDTAKLAVVGALLRDRRLVVLFDDFEQNLTDDGRGFTDPGFADLFGALTEATTTGRLLVTSRYPLPRTPVPLARIPLGPLSTSELGRLLQRMPKLRAVPAGERRLVFRAIGGHPRLVEFVDALLRGGVASMRDVTRKLTDLAEHLGVDLRDERTVTDAVADALLLGSRDILLDQLVGLLSDDERAVLLQAAVSNAPMNSDDLALAWHGANPDPDPRRTVRAVRRLVDLTLLGRSDGDDLLVHPWIAEALRALDDGGWPDRHSRALDMRWTRLRSSRWVFADLVDAGRHYAALSRFDDLEQFTHAAIAAIGGTSGSAALLGELVPLVPPVSRPFLILVDLELGLLTDLGLTAAARTRGQALIDTARRLAEADPSNSQAQRDLSISYERLADMAVRNGDLDTARQLFDDAIAIHVRLAEADPSNVSKWRDLLYPMNRLADVITELGDAEQGVAIRREATDLARRLGYHIDADEGGSGEPAGADPAYGGAVLGGSGGNI
jgi:hypothetical protein